MQLNEVPNQLFKNSLVEAVFFSNQNQVSTHATFEMWVRQQFLISFGMWNLNKY